MATSRLSPRARSKALEQNRTHPQRRLVLDENRSLPGVTAATERLAAGQIGGIGATAKGQRQGRLRQKDRARVRSGGEGQVDDTRPCAPSSAGSARPATARRSSRSAIASCTAARTSSSPMLIDAKVLEKLRRLIPLAPLHEPHNIAGIEAAMKAFPSTPQVACFDTAFHRGQPFVDDTFALPRAYYEEGVRRYGFHGLSYEYIARRLQQDGAGDRAPDASSSPISATALRFAPCATAAPIASTMGFTALDGLPMGTRCGQLDPGVVLYLMAEKKMSAEEISDLLYKNPASRACRASRRTCASSRPRTGRRRARPSTISSPASVANSAASPPARRHRRHRLHRRHRRACLARARSGAEGMEWIGVRLDARGQSRRARDHQRPLVAGHGLRHPDRRGTDDRRAYGEVAGLADGRPAED